MTLPNPLYRTFSMCDDLSTMHIRDYIDAQEQNMYNCKPNLNREVTKSTMIIPSLKQQVVDPLQREFTLHMVADIEQLNMLEREKSVNWSNFTRNLVPLRTENDGNDLLHSLCLYIVGVHDRKFVFRKLLHRRLEMELGDGLLFRRWQEQESQFRHSPIIQNYDTHPFQSSEQLSWQQVVIHSSLREYSNGPEGKRFFPLCCIHIFTICNIIARPIIVLCDAAYRNEEGRSMRQQRIGGIYLPMLRDPSECERSPIVIGYSRGSFMPLISSEDIDVPLCTSTPSNEAQHCIPLVRYDQSKLPVHFLLPNETADDKIHTYLEVCNIPSSDAPGSGLNPPIPAALFKFRAPLAWSIQMMWSLMKVADEMYARLNLNVENKVSVSSVDMRNSVMKDPSENLHNLNENTTVKENIYEYMLPCSRHVLGCQNFASENTHRMCITCFAVFKDKKSKVPVRPLRKEPNTRVQGFESRAYDNLPPSPKPLISPSSSVPVSSHINTNLPTLNDPYDMNGFNDLKNPQELTNHQNPNNSPSRSKSHNRSNSPQPPSSPRYSNTQSGDMSNFNNDMRPSYEFEKRLLKKCINEPCNGDGIAALDNKCRDCYVVSVHQRTGSSLVSEPGRPDSEPALQRFDQMRLNPQGIPSAQGGSNPPHVQRLPDQSYIRAKTICAEPGCNNPPIENDLCQLHLNQPPRPVAMCILCELRVVDDVDTQLCNACVDQQRERLSNTSHEKPQQKQQLPNTINEHPRRLPQDIDTPPRGQFSHDNNSLLATSGLQSQDQLIHPQTYQGYPINAYNQDLQNPIRNEPRHEAHDDPAVPRAEQCSKCINFASKEGLCNTCWTALERLKANSEVFYRGPAPKTPTESISYGTLCIEGCGQPAVMANNGLCHDCYEKVLSKEKCMIASETQKIGQRAVTGNPCKTRGCTLLTGNLSQDFCDRCMREGLAAPALGFHHQNNYQNQYGNPQQQGYHQQQTVQIGFEPYAQNWRSQPAHNTSNINDFTPQRQGISNGFSQGISNGLSQGVPNNLPQGIPNISGAQYGGGHEHMNGFPNIRQSASANNINAPLESTRAHSAITENSVPHRYLHSPEYERMSRSDPLPHYNNPVSSSNPFIMNPGPSRKCKGLNCELFGGIEYNGYCSKCFLDITKHEAANLNNRVQADPPMLPEMAHLSLNRRSSTRSHGSTSSTEDLPPVSGVAATTQCRTIGCDMFGRPEWSGMCSKCFKESRMNDYVRDVF